MPIKLHGQLMHDKTLIEYTTPPYYNIVDSLEPLFNSLKTLVLDFNGDFYLQQKDLKNVTVMLVKPSYTEYSKLIKYLNFERYTLLIINTIRPILLSGTKNLLLKFINRLWRIIYDNDLTVIYVNGYERRMNERNESRYIPKYERVLSPLISYRILVSPENEQTECGQNTIVVQKYEPE